MTIVDICQTRLFLLSSQFVSHSVTPCIILDIIWIASVAMIKRKRIKSLGVSEYLENILKRNEIGKKTFTGLQSVSENYKIPALFLKTVNSQVYLYILFFSSWNGFPVFYILLLSQ